MSTGLTNGSGHLSFKQPERILSGSETVWRDNYHLLLARGYRLRPRYHPDWTPSWRTNELRIRYMSRCEDAQRRLGDSPVMDATRVSDGSFVMLKMIDSTTHAHELEIITLLSSEKLASPENHCVPVLESFALPDSDSRSIVVMPLVLDLAHAPPFKTVGEAVDFFRQIFEAVKFLHQNHVAHRDIMNLNILMDAKAMYPVPWHPIVPIMKRDWTDMIKSNRTRTECHSRYYLADFGISRQYDASDPHPLELVWRGGDKTVPEFQNFDGLCDPFATDIYYVGNVVRVNFLIGDTHRASAKRGFEFIRPLINDMVQDDPTKRPSADEVVKRFDEILLGLHSWKLRGRIIKHSESMLGRFFRFFPHWTSNLKYAVLGLPALPAQA